VRHYAGSRLLDISAKIRTIENSFTPLYRVSKFEVAT
jgi:hypothetical protein